MTSLAAFTGPCAGCCTCPEAEVEWDSRSASKTRGGPESSYGCYSDAGSYFNTKATTTFIGLPDDTYEELFNGACPGSSPYRINSQTYTGDGYTEIITETCGHDATVEKSGNWHIVGVQTDYRETSPGSCDYSVLQTIRTITDDYVYNDATEAWEWERSDRLQTFWPSSSDTTSYSSGAGIAPTGTTTVTITYENEITVDVLESDTISSLLPYDDDWNDTAGSFADLSEDQLTYSVREARYRIRFEIPIIGYGDCYKVTWVERFTPEGGGAVTDTDRCAIWDGTTPPGYAPDDSATWPVLPSASPNYYELSIPPTNGTVTVENVVSECLDCSACP